MTIVIGTRGSALALRQTEYILHLLRERWPGEGFEVREISTLGDRVQNRAISDLGDKGIFVRGIEASLISGEIDLAVHSLKDVPADVEMAGLVLAAFSPRADPRDVLVSRSGEALDTLPAGARIGTGSVRRRVQLRVMRPDVELCEIRGNVDTRLRKLDEGQYDAILLAAAGLERLGLMERITQYLDPEHFVPDAGQGIIVVQGRLGDRATELVAAISDPVSEAAARAERAVVRGLQAGCHDPVGAYAAITGATLRLIAMAAAEDGANLRRATVEGPADAAERLGALAAADLQRESLGAGGPASYTEP